MCSYHDDHVLKDSSIKDSCDAVKPRLFGLRLWLSKIFYIIMGMYLKYTCALQLLPWRQAFYILWGD